MTKTSLSSYVESIGFSPDYHEQMVATCHVLNVTQPEKVQSQIHEYFRRAILEPFRSLLAGRVRPMIAKLEVMISLSLRLGN